MLIMDVCFVALAIFYLIISLISISRLIKVISAKVYIKLIITIYSGMLITALSRSVSFCYLGFFPSEKFNIISYLLIISPDMLNICVYLLLVWYFLSNLINSHINLANDVNLYDTNNYYKDVPSLGKKTYILLYFVIPIMMVFFIVISFLSYYKVMGEVLLIILYSGANALLPLLFFGYYLFILFKLSGRPYKSDVLKNQSRNILYIVIVWSGARIFVGIFMMFKGQFYIKSIDDEMELEKKDDSIWSSIYIIAYFLVSEFLPNFFALDYSFIMSYLTNENVTKHVWTSSPEDRLSPPISSDVTENKSTERLLTIIPSNEKKNININDFLVKSNELSVLENIFSRKNGFGSINRGTFKNCEVICRSIKFDRLSRYDLEEFLKDFEEIVILEHQFIASVVSVSLENVPSIFILYRCYKKKSLFDLLHIEKCNLDLEKRIKIAKNIAKGMEYLHEHKIFHSHLSSRNILIDDDLNPKITDFGFKSLKENASIFLKYKNKNAYSAPEILLDKKRIANSYTKLDYHSDVYSFGMILWEIYTMTIPFNVAMKSIYKMVAVENYRPQIQKDFNISISNIIRSCWDVDITKRPNFTKICLMLNNVKI